MRETRPTTREGTSRRRGVSVALFVWAFAGVGLMVGAWTLATPIGAAPDEAAHTTQAAAIVRGQFDVPEQSFDGEPLSLVRVPCWVDNPWLHIPYQGCLSGKATMGLAPTEFSNYPPLYYVVVGLPSLFLSGNGAIYAMNAVGDLLTTVLAALGIWLLLRYHPHRLVLVGALVAVSPTVLFFMAVLNTSGLEIAAGFAAWCGALCVVTYRQLPRSLGVWTAVALILLVLTRPASPLDLVIIVVVLAFYVGWRHVRDWLDPSVRPLWIPVAVSLVIAGGFLVVDGLPRLIGIPAAHPAGLLSNVATTVRLSGAYVEDSVGDFGSFGNLPAPTWVTIAWGACTAALTGAALALSRPCRRALPVLALAVVGLAVVLEAPELNTIGPYFSARYVLPLLVGFPVVAASFEWQGRLMLSRRQSAGWALVIGAVLLAGQVAAIHGNLQAYGTAAHGISATPPDWSPPGGAVLVQAVFAFGAFAMLSLVLLMVSGVGDRLMPATPPQHVPNHG